MPKKTKITLIIIFLIYSSVIVMVYAAESAGSIGLKLLALVLISGLQVHLQILHHEGAHFNLHGNRKINDIISDLFCSLPFLGFTKHYRYFHLQHHKHLLDPIKDPEVDFYKQQGYDFEKKSLPMYLKDFSGYHYLQFFYAYTLYLIKNKNPRLKLDKTELVLALVMIGIFIIARRYILFYWLLPQATIQFGLLKQQGYGEHSARKETIAQCTHNGKPNLVQRFFIYPLNSHLHLTHHLKPKLPWYELTFMV